ncbi:MAG: hypothetical protein HYU66_28040 [Armatimonadetes bacterium]|nr:hypothetical protein [Armatimonadota bacterium]
MDGHLYTRTPRPQNLVRPGLLGAEVFQFAWDSFDVEEDEFVEGLPLAEPPEEAAADPRRAAPGYGLSEIMSEAEAIIREAEAKASRFETEAQVRIRAEEERIRQEALERARAEAAAAPDPARAEAVESLVSATRALAAARAEVLGQWQSIHQQLETDLTEAAFVLARQVVGQELRLRPELVVDSVREALGKVAPNGVTVRLHPEDLPHVMEVLVDLRAELGLGDVDFAEDPRVERGGCLVTTENGTVDTQPGSKLEQLRSAAEG